MTLGRLVVRNLQQRALSSVLTALSVALGVMLVAAILVLRAEMEESFLRPGRGYSLVVGPHGSGLQLVLNTVYHLDQSSGLIPFRIQEELAAHPSTRLAVPYAVGDSFRGYRVVGTTEAFFSPHFPHPAGTTPESKLAAGRPFHADPHLLQEALAALRSGRVPEAEGHAAHDEVWEAVLGAEVAEKLRLGIGDRIEPTHGVEGEAAHREEHLWTVVGILRRSDTPVDRVVFINLDSFYRIADHAGGLIPGSGEPGLSAVLLFPKPGVHKGLLLPRLRQRPEFQVAEVHREIQNLFQIVGNVDRIFLLVAALVVVIGVVAVMVALYNTMNERRREIAILRALGGRARTVLLTIVSEAMLLAGAGGAAGLLLAHLLLLGLGPQVEAAAGLKPDPLRVLPAELLVLVLVTLVGALAGLIPAGKAYRTDVASNLAPLS